MACSKCGVIHPEPTDTWEEDDGDSIPAYWFLVVKDQPVEMAGIEEGGEIALRFRACTTLEHPEPEEGERVLCGDCFSEEYPVPEDMEEEDERRD